MRPYLIMLVMLLTAAGITLWASHQYVKKGYDAMDRVLDSLLNKRPPPAVEGRGESRLSKLSHKAARIVRNNTSDLSQTQEEKLVIQQFLSDMSHQMKTPLAGVTMYTDLLLEGNMTAEEGQEFLQRIKAGTERLQWLMDSLVKMSRLEANAIELKPVPASLKQTLAESINGVYALAAKREITIQTEDFEDRLLLFDPRWTVEALLNILENGVKYGPPRSEIHIQVETLPLYTKISITDEGMGIDPGEWHHIFKRFYRGSNGTRVEGAGLGLYLTSLILEKQGGYVLVDSKPGLYTTFSVFLQNCKKSA